MRTLKAIRAKHSHLWKRKAQQPAYGNFGVGTHAALSIWQSACRHCKHGIEVELRIMKELESSIACPKPRT
eukprot:scaffold18923_cov21-Tisochrysis_lutea.AAC.2